MKGNHPYRELVDRFYSVLVSASFVEDVSPKPTKEDALIKPTKEEFSNRGVKIEYDFDVKLRPEERIVRFLGRPLWRRYTKLPTIVLIEYVRQNDGFGQLEPQEDGFAYRTQMTNYFGNVKKDITGTMRVHIK